MSQRIRVGARIKAIRKMRGITQEKLADLAERSVDAISALERGVSLPSFETLEKLAYVLGTPLRDFFDVDDTDVTDETRERLLTQLNLHARSLTSADLEVAIKQIGALAGRSAR